MVFAYLDPGAGSLVIQAILAAALTVPFFLRTQLSSFVARVRGKRPETDDSAKR
jgi:hypothetical protein